MKKERRTRICVTTCAASAVAIAIALVNAQAAAPKPIQLHVPMHSCSAPCDMTVTVVIPKHPDNRSASVVWSYSDSAELSLKETQQVEFPVPIGRFNKGDHTVYAVLVREKDGRQVTFEDSQHITVH
jgi:hypothetical protein